MFVWEGRDGETLVRHGGRNVWRESGQGWVIWEGEVNVGGEYRKGCGDEGICRREVDGEGAIWEGK